MYAEEARARKFYKDELKNGLRERREMKNAEAEMRLYVGELKVMADLAASKYRVAGTADDDLGPSTKEQRRMQIKEGRAGGLVRKREIEAMMREDELSMAIRTEEKKAEQLAALKREMELMTLDADGDEAEAEEDDDDDDDDDDAGYVSSVLSEDSNAEDDDGPPEAPPPPPEESEEQGRVRLKAERKTRQQYPAAERKSCPSVLALLCASSGRRPPSDPAKIIGIGLRLFEFRLPAGRRRSLSKAFDRLSTE